MDYEGPVLSSVRCLPCFPRAVLPSQSLHFLFSPTQRGVNLDKESLETRVFDHQGRLRYVTGEKKEEGQGCRRAGLPPEPSLSPVGHTEQDYGPHVQGCVSFSDMKASAF